MRNKPMIKRIFSLTFLSILLLTFSENAFAQIGNYNPNAGSLNLIPGVTGSIVPGCFVPLPTQTTGNFYFVYSTSGSPIASNVTMTATYSGSSSNTVGANTPFYFNGNNIQINVTASSTAAFCTSQTINVTIYKGGPMGYYAYCSYAITVTCRDNSKNNLVALASGMYYVTADARIDCQYWDANLGSWQYQQITPVGGWGGIQVDGWLAADYNYDQIFFKGRDLKLYNLYKSAGNWYVGALSSTVANVAGCIKLRQSDGVYYIGTDAKIHHMYWNSSGWNYEAIAPWNGWPVTAAGVGITIGYPYYNISGASLELAPAPASNIYFRASDNKVYNIVGSTGSWGLGQISPSGAVDCAGDMTTDNTGVYYRGTDNFVHKLYWTSSGWAYDPMTVSNLSTGNVKGHLSKFPGENRVFYKGTDNLLYNVYQSGTSWLVYSLDYNVNTVAGDVLAADQHIYFISTDNRPHNFWWNGSAWVDNALTYSVANAKGCSLNYRMGEEQSSGIQSGDGHTEAGEMHSSIFPNPGNGVLTLTYQHEFSATAHLVIYNTMGEQVQETDISNLAPEGKELYQLDASELSRGMYFVVLQCGDEWRETHRLIIN